MNRIGGLVMFLVLVFAVPGIALASSYNIWYEFDSTLTGPWRSYDGQNIEFQLNSTASGATAGATFTVQLNRKTLFGFEMVGSASAPQNGSKTIRWSNVGPGTYNSYFSKNYTDGVWVTGTGVFRNY